MNALQSILIAALFVAPSFGQAKDDGAGEQQAKAANRLQMHRLEELNDRLWKDPAFVHKQEEIIRAERQASIDKGHCDEAVTTSEVGIFVERKKFFGRPSVKIDVHSEQNTFKQEKDSEGKYHLSFYHFDEDQGREIRKAVVSVDGGKIADYVIKGPDDKLIEECHSDSGNHVVTESKLKNGTR